MRIYSIISVAAVAVMTSLWSSAQYDQSFEVEGRYVPEIIAHDRIGQFPKPMHFGRESSSLEYAMRGTTADFRPEAIPMSATAWGTDHRWDRSRGYLDIGAGSYLTSTLSAGYRIVETERGLFGVSLQHNSTSLWKPEMSAAMSDTRRRRYDETVSVYGHYNFKEQGRLTASADYHIGNFNYYGFAPVWAGLTDREVKAPTQTLNDVSALIGWQSVTGRDKIGYNVGLGVRYFGFRSYYYPGEAETIREAGSRETDIMLRGGVNFPTSAQSSLGIDLSGHAVSYGGPSEGPGTYGVVTLTPYYRFVRYRMNIEIGAQVDLSFNAGRHDDRYGLFHIAPRVKFDYNAGPATLYLHLLGGSQLHTLAGGYDEDYYRSPRLYDTSPVYTPLDAKFGVGTGPFAGVSFGADIAFRASRGQYLGGMYQLCLNDRQGEMPVAGADRLTGGLNPAYVYDFDGDTKTNLTGMSIGMNIGYDGGRYFKIKAEGRWQPQDGKKGYFNGFDRPKCTVGASIESNPWSSLRFKLGYTLRAARGVEVMAHRSDTHPLNSAIIEKISLPNSSLLGFGASYDITGKLDVWIQADNLLNREEVCLPGLPEPGVRLSAGLGWRF